MPFRARLLLPYQGIEVPSILCVTIAEESQDQTVAPLLIVDRAENAVSLQMCHVFELIEKGSFVESVTHGVSQFSCVDKPCDHFFKTILPETWQPCQLLFGQYPADRSAKRIRE